MRPILIFISSFLFSFIILSPTDATAQGDAQSPESSSRASRVISESIERATDHVNKNQKYSLAYRFKKGDRVRWQVEHIASTRTQMAGESEETSSRSQSVKLWEITSVDSLGQMTFDHKIESVDMWQKIGEEAPVSYNSKKDKEAPLEYESIADKIGTTIATVSINPAGQIVDRKTDNPNQANFGVGDIAIPLPTKPVTVGYKWSVPDTLRAKDRDGNPRQLKSRVVYKLVKVKSNNAYISFKTEVLTPIESEKIRSQIMQQMTRGYLVFDIDRGYPIRKEVEWDEKVQGFEGPDSLLEYLGRMSERLVIGNAEPQVSRKPEGTSLKPLR
jgi:hypothetical protein